MITAKSIQDSLRDGVANWALYPTSEVAYFCQTEQLGYIHFDVLCGIELTTDMNDMLGYVLTKNHNPFLYYQLIDWVANIELCPLAVDKIADIIQEALYWLNRDHAQCKGDLNCQQLQGLLSQIETVKLANLFAIKPKSPFIEPRSPDDGGSHNMYFWQDSVGNFYYLQIHVES